MKTLPLEFCERMKSLLGDQYDAFLAALNEHPVKAFRVNTDKIALEDLDERFCALLDVTLNLPLDDDGIACNGLQLGEL